MTLLTFKDKYVVASTTPVTTISPTLVDDTEASQTFNLDASKVVLVIYQANNVYGATMPVTGMQNAINVDDVDKANSWDSPYGTNQCTRNCVFWLGILAAGSHTVKGRFASNSSGSTATISNRVLNIIIFDGDEFSYIDDPTTATHDATTFIDDPNAQVTFTPSATCKALVLYNIANSGGIESAYGKKAAINIGDTDYGQAEKSPDTANYTDSVFTCHGLNLSSVSTTVKGRFANAGAAETVTIHRRQLAVLLFADSTLLDVVTSTTQVSTTSSALVDDIEASISRTTTDTREFLLVAMGTKRSGVFSSGYGECYGIKINTNDRVNSRGSPSNSGRADSAGTAYAEQLAAGSHTINGRFSNNVGTNTAKIDARQVVALWLTVGGAPTLKEVTDNLSLSDAVLRDKTLAVLDSLGLADVPLKSWTPQISDSITLSEAILRNKTFSITDSITLSEIVEVITGAIIKYVEDSLGLSDAVKINKTLIISDVLGLLDQVFRHKPQISITDAIALAEVVAVSKLFTITDAVSIADVVYVMKTLPIYDQITIIDQVSTPTRILQALDAVGLSDNAYVNKTLIITDQIALAEVVEVGKGVAKTKLFLVIGDLAIQISG